MNTTNGALEIMKSALSAHGFEYHVCGGFTRGHLDLCHVGDGIFEVYNDSTGERFHASFEQLCDNWVLS